MKEQLLNRNTVVNMNLVVARIVLYDDQYAKDFVVYVEALSTSDVFEMVNSSGYQSSQPTMTVPDALPLLPLSWVRSSYSLIHSSKTSFTRVG